MMTTGANTLTGASRLNLADISGDFLAQSGQEMHRLIAELYPICRSITGDGVRETLAGIARHVSLPLDIQEVPTGTPAFDWTVPQEWNIRDAYIKNSRGERLVDFHAQNLHVVGYSAPVHLRLRLDELKEHLFTLPDYPDRIPYRTSYYKESWGFCLTHSQFVTLSDDEEYEVFIDSTLAPGHLTYGEWFLPGTNGNEEEILISCHVCHPSLCNDNLSGIALAAHLAEYLNRHPHYYTYRFVFIPGTIGSITWLSRNEDKVGRIKHGLVVTGVGDAGAITYKKSRRGDAEIDRAMQNVLKYSGAAHQIIDFYPFGYDERQYCSPGFNLPVGCFMRSRHGHYSEYHTSADNLDFVQPPFLADSLVKILEVLNVLENNVYYQSLNPKCEPQLGKRGLYRAMGGASNEKMAEMALLWVLNLADGTHSLLDMSNLSGLPFENIRQAATLLAQHDLLEMPASDAALISLQVD